MEEEEEEEEEEEKGGRRGKGRREEKASLVSRKGRRASINKRTNVADNVADMRSAARHAHPCSPSAQLSSQLTARGRFRTCTCARRRAMAQRESRGEKLRLRRASKHIMQPRAPWAAAPVAENVHAQRRTHASSSARVSQSCALPPSAHARPAPVRPRSPCPGPTMPALPRSDHARPAPVRPRPPCPRPTTPALPRSDHARPAPVRPRPAPSRLSAHTVALMAMSANGLSCLTSMKAPVLRTSRS